MAREEISTGPKQTDLIDLYINLLQRKHEVEQELKIEQKYNLQLEVYEIKGMIRELSLLLMFDSIRWTCLSY